jgi:hypothetical protein
MAALLAPVPPCSVCGAAFKDGDVLIFERKATCYTDLDTRVHYDGPGKRQVTTTEVLRIRQSPSRIRVARHEVCP